MDAESYLDDTGLATDSLDDDYDSTWVDDGTLPAERFLDRELSWLAFNQRVLELAEDESVPLLERVNFLAIFASNLDEFFMVRVAGLKRRIMTGLAVPTNVGREPLEVLAAISAQAHALQSRHATVFRDLVKPALDESGIHIETWADLDDEDRVRIDEIFSNQIFPVLMPLAVEETVGRQRAVVDARRLVEVVLVERVSGGAGVCEAIRAVHPPILPLGARLNHGVVGC